VNVPLWLWSGFTALGLLTLTYTNDLIPGVRIASGYVGNILVLFTVMNLVRGDTLDETRRRADIAILYWLAASTAVAAYSIWDWHFGSGRTGGIPVTSLDPQAGAQLAKYRWATVWIDSAEEQTLGGLSIRRSMGSTSHAAVFGINLIMSLPFYLYVIARERGKGFLLSGLMWLGLAASMYCVLLTNTRATLAAAIGVLGLSVMLKLVRITPVMILGGIALVLLGPLVLPVDIFERVLDWKNYSTTRSAAMSIRLDYWGSGWRAITEHPIMGNGLGNQRVVLEYLKNPIEGKSHMHNIYLTTLMDVGVFGWMVFLGFLIATVRACVRARRIFRTIGDIASYQMMSATLVLMIGVLVYGMQVDVFYFPLKAWWLVIGMMFVMSRHAEGIRTTLVHGVPKQATT
jgi:O-antigen ligase